MKSTNYKDGLPKSCMAFVGTTQTLSGGIFSSKKDLKPTDFNILDVRWGTATVVDMKSLLAKGESDYEHPTFELLLKNENMARAQWSRPFPIREINLKEKKKRAPKKRSAGDKKRLASKKRTSKSKS